MGRNPCFPKRVLSSCCSSELYYCCAMAVTNGFWHRGRKQIQTGWMHTLYLVSDLLWDSEISQYFLHSSSVLAIAFCSEQHLTVICCILSSFFCMYSSSQKILKLESGQAWIVQSEIHMYCSWGCSGSAVLHGCTPWSVCSEELKLRSTFLLRYIIWHRQHTYLTANLLKNKKKTSRTL